MKLLEAVLLLIGGFIVIAVILGSMGGNVFGHGVQTQPNFPHADKISSLVVTGSPTITVQKINAILDQAGSPARGTGQALYNLGLQYNINPSVALAFFQHESTYGKFGVAATTRSLGNLRCFCKSTWQYFDSWVEGYRAWYSLISGPLYVKAGLTTVKQIIPKYAPNADGNNEAAYIEAVETAVRNWRATP